MKPTELASRARVHGSIVRSDLVPKHLTPGGWTRLHRSGVLRRLHPGVSCLATTTATDLGRIEAATLAVPEALAAGPTAAWLWGAASAPPADPVHLVVADRAYRRSLEGVLVHRPTDHADLEPSRWQHIATVSPLHAVLGVAAWAPDLTVSALEELIVARRMAIGAVEAVLERHARSGVPGVRVLRHAWASWVAAGRPPDSVLEARMAALLRRAGLPDAESQTTLGPYRVDFCWPWLMAVLECDGWEFHGRQREDFEAERDRDAWLEAKGWTVWRYSWSQVTQRPTWVVSTLRDRIASRSAQLGVRAG